MKQWSLIQPRRVKLREVPIPAVGPEDILFKVSCAGISGSDIAVYNRGSCAQSWPAVPGHEFCGRVVETGSRVRDIPVGMRFTGAELEWCGECELCRSGRYLLCSRLSRRGPDFGPDGMLAEYAVLHNAILNVSVFPLPDSVSDTQAVLCSPISAAVDSCRSIDPSDGDRIVIYGAGALGQAFIQAVRAAAPRAKILAADISDLRLRLALESGADNVVNPAKECTALEKAWKLWGSGVGADATAAIECTGSPTCVSEAFQIVGQNGKVCLAAGYDDDLVCLIHPNDIARKGLRLISGHTADFRAAVDGMSGGKFRTEHLITHVYPLEQYEEALQTAMDARRSGRVCVADAPDVSYSAQEL